MNKKFYELSDYFNLVWKRKFVIIASTFVYMIAAGVVSFLLPKIYEASVSIMILVPKMAGAGKIATLKPLATYEGIIKNKSLEKKIIEKFKIHQPPYNMTINDLNENISLKFFSNSDLIQLKVEFPNAQLAQQIANELAKLGVELNKNLIENEAIQSKNLIKEQLDEAKKKLIQSENKYLKFKSTAQIETLKKELQIQLKLKGDNELFLENIESVLERDRATFQEITEQLKYQEKTFKLIYSLGGDPNYLRSLAALTKADIKDLVSYNVEKEEPNPVFFNLQDKLTNIASTIKGNLAQKLKIASVLKENAAKLKQIEYDLALKELEMDRLSRELRQAQDIYKIFVDQYDKIRMEITTLSRELVIIDTAIIPTEAIKPNIILNVITAGFIGLFISIFLFLFYSYLKTS